MSRLLVSVFSIAVVVLFISEFLHAVQETDRIQHLPCNANEKLIKLPRGQKMVSFDWKEGWNLTYLTRDHKVDEKKENYIIQTKELGCITVKEEW